MQTRYSEMSEHELKSEISKLTEKARKAEQMGIVNELAVHERKIAVAKAYLLDPADFKTEVMYEIADTKEQFQIRYLNGVFAWGYRLSSPEHEEALPISLLKEKD
ncbi:YfhH family protein [Bacillus sp. WMMC1349]|uniref:YfhH family protein n=1 Tax=Bacillus sp. WMMC1349 TaxID=2736254 RepID=UPI0015556055|nr:YfhH family protein [Bacillus sp. WMMC1349]NPC91897.1 YfhH family protein [Bacillus sp. WMMC1349]